MSRHVTRTVAVKTWLFGETLFERPAQIVTTEAGAEVSRTFWVSIDFRSWYNTPVEITRAEDKQGIHEAHRIYVDSAKIAMRGE